MRTIIAGSRTITNPQFIIDAVKNCGWEISTIIEGGAIGVDTLARNYAKQHSIQLETYPAEWKKWGKSAAYIRNQQMATKAEALIAIWDGQSKGTKHMIDIAEAAKLKIYVLKIPLV